MFAPLHQLLEKRHGPAAYFFAENKKDETLIRRRFHPVRKSS
jgi:hypothetical protein